MVRLGHGLKSRSLMMVFHVRIRYLEISLQMSHLEATYFIDTQTVLRLNTDTQHLKPDV